MNRNGLLLTCLSLTLLGGTGSPTLAQTPVINAVTPSAVLPGQTLKVIVTGGQLQGATTLWTSFPAEVKLDPDTPENGKQGNQTVFQVTVPAEIPVGVHGCRLITDHGVSELRLLMIDDLPTLQQGNNTTRETALPLSLPTAVEGHVDAKGFRYFRFSAAAGERVSFEVLARRIGSPLDPVLRLLDAQGHEIDYSDDVPGLNGDSQLTYTFPQAGEYLLELRDIQYQGSGNHRYRLRVGDFPCVTAPYPLAVQRGTQVELQFAGKNLESLMPTTVIVPADLPQDYLSVGAQREAGKPNGFASVMITSQPEFRETEPNDQNEQSQRITLGDNINGRLQNPKDRDQFIFTATKGQNFTFRANTREYGSPADLVLLLLNAQGGVVAQNDDAGTDDAVLSFTFPADGDYILRVEELSDRGGSEYVYRVAVAPTAPTFSLSVSVSTVNVPVGGVARINVTATRQGYNGPIHLSASGLPEGFTVHPSVLGTGINTGTMTIQATNPDQAKAFFGQAIPLKLIGRISPENEASTVVATIAGALSAAQVNFVKLPRAVAESVMLTAQSAPGFTLRTEPATIQLSKELKTPIKVIVERTPEFDEAITLALDPPQNGVPKGVTIQPQPIAKGQNEIQFEIALNNETPDGPFSIVLTGAHKKGNETQVQPTPGVLISVGNPAEVVLEAAPGELAQGTSLKAKVRVQRIPAFTGELTVELKNLPQGVTAAPVTIPGDQSEVEVELKAAPDAPPTSVENVLAEGTAKVGNTTFKMNSSPVKLQVKTP